VLYGSEKLPLTEKLRNKIRTDEYDYLRCPQGARENRLRNEILLGKNGCYFINDKESRK
jgi:hypothetical protein